MHALSIPTDSHSHTGKLTGTRLHSPLEFEKEFDSSSPYLYKAVSSGQTLKSAEIKWYRINHAGQEEYFNMLLENVKIVSVCPIMHNIKRSLTRIIWRRSRCAMKKSPGNIATAIFSMLTAGKSELKSLSPAFTGHTGRDAPFS